MDKIDVSLSLPEYTLSKKPDADKIGQKIDAALHDNFPKQQVVIRCISLIDHQPLSLDALASKVKQDGTDKYNPAIPGIGYQVAKDKVIDFFGLPADLASKEQIMARFVHDFYYSALKDRGSSLRIDLVLVYDKNKIAMVENLYEGYAKSDGWTFKDPTDKSDALIGIVQLR